MSFATSAVPQKSLEGKVAIITGGARGIGASAVRIFHENGAKVIIADIQDDEGRAIANKLGKNVSFVHCDVTNEDDIRNVVETAVADHGKLDIMYNNAGVIDKPFGSILDATKSDLEKVIGVNLMGSFLGAKHASKVMIPQRHGCILFTTSACTSIAGLGTHPYTASKYAVLGLSKNLTAELGQFGIRVNCVSPSAVVTDQIMKNYVDQRENNLSEIMGNLKGQFGINFNYDVSPSAMVPEMTKDFVTKASQTENYLSEIGNLRGHVLKADDVAKAALYLASDEAHYISGINLVIDGGFSVVNPTLMKALNLIQ